MTLKEYLKELNSLVTRHPHISDLEVIHSSDDEGNSFHSVVYTPTIGVYEGTNIYNTNPDKRLQNAVCLN